METGLKIDDKVINPTENLSPFAAIQNFRELTAGPTGTFKVNERGLWIGQTQIIDNQGLNSLNNFQSDTWFDGTNRTTTSTSYTDITNAVLSSFTLTRTARVLTYLRVKTYNDNLISDGYLTDFTMYDTFDGDVTDGVSTGGEATTRIDWDTGTGLVNSTSQRLRSLELASISNDLYIAGTHQFKTKWKVNGGTGNLFELQMGYVILGI